MLGFSNVMAISYSINQDPNKEPNGPIESIAAKQQKHHWM